MVATALVPTKRYIPPGLRQYYFVETIVDYTAPTRAELDAGTALEAEMSAAEGFQVTSETVDTPDLGSRFVSKIAGRITVDNPQLTLYASNDSQDVRLILAQDVVGFIVKFPEGDASTKLMDVFPITVSSCSVQDTVEDPATVVVMCAVTGVPALNVTIPTV